MANGQYLSPLGLFPEERTYFFVEGANFYALTKYAEITADYKRILDHFVQASSFVRASYYTSVVEDQEYSSIRPLLDFLDYNGYRVVTKTAKEHTDSLGRRKIKGSLDVEIAVDMVKAADPRRGRADHIVLFSGDGDFHAAVTECQDLGARVTIVSSREMCADALRRQADRFVDVTTPAVRALISKDEREVQREQRELQRT